MYHSDLPPFAKACTEFACLGCVFFAISRKNCKIIFHWFYFSRILRKEIHFWNKKIDTYISSFHASKFLGLAPKINLWDWFLIKYFNLQDTNTLSVILNNIFTQKIRKGAWHQTSFWGRGVKMKTLTRSYKKAKLGNYRIENQNELPIVFEKMSTKPQQRFDWKGGGKRGEH